MVNNDTVLFVWDQTLHHLIKNKNRNDQSVLNVRILSETITIIKS